jgi:hypothetical protein
VLTKNQALNGSAIFDLPISVAAFSGIFWLSDTTGAVTE